MNNYKPSSQGTPLEKLVLKYINLVVYNESEEQSKQLLFNTIKNQLSPKVKITLAKYNNFYYFNPERLHGNVFDEFMVETLNHYLEAYNPKYINPRYPYKKTPDFEAFYLSKMYPILSKLYENDNWKEMCERNLVEKARKRKIKEIITEEIKEELTLARECILEENKPVVKIPILKDKWRDVLGRFDNIIEVARTIRTLDLKNVNIEAEIKNVCEGRKRSYQEYKWMYLEDWEKRLKEEKFKN